MKIIKVYSFNVKTLSEIAKVFKISSSKVSEVKKKLESDFKEKYNSTNYWGTGKNKRYDLRYFAEKLGVKLEKKYI